MISSLLYKTTVAKIPQLDLPEYLAAQEIFPKFYHKCKDTGEERGAFGSVVTLPFVPALPSDIDPSLCFYGAVSFPSFIKDAVWSDFPAALFFLPIYEIRQTEDETFLCTRSFISQALPNPPLSLPEPILSGIREDTPSKELWTDSVRRVLQAIEKEKAAKVVLSRRSTFEIDPSTHPFAFVKKLKTEMTGSSTFAFQTTPSSVFLGSSPEKLYRRQGELLETEAIAGTRKRGKSPEEDLLLVEDLLGSTKDQSEALYVKDFLSKTLSSLCKTISFPEKASVLQTSTVSHLHYPCKAVLKSDLTDADLLSVLCPTPAVNGTPKEEALLLIRELETHGRGLYAGCVGMLSSLESSFTVSIRSALIKENKLHAFAGAGIVAGSDPDSERGELDHKISHWKIGCTN